MKKSSGLTINEEEDEIGGQKVEVNGLLTERKINDKQEMERKDGETSSRVAEGKRVLAFKKGHIIDKGSHGEVYQCFDLNTGQLYAVKTIRKDKKKDILEREVASLQKEISEYKKLSHKNIVKYIDTELDEDEKGINIIFEFVSGGSIRQMLDKFGKFNEKVISIYSHQVLEGLNYLHSNNVIHRDIKGGNILIDTDGTIKLTDFGTLKLHKKDAQMLPNPNMSLSSAVDQRNLLGSKPFWTAPEVLNNENLNESHSDIWSLGCLVIEMFTALPPYFSMCDRFTNEEITQYIKEGNLPEFPKKLSPLCLEFLEKTLQVDPKKRATVKELLSLKFIADPDSVEAVEQLSPRMLRNGQQQSQSSLGQRQDSQPRFESKQMIPSKSKQGPDHHSDSQKLMSKIRRDEKNIFDDTIAKLFKEPNKDNNEARDEYKQQLISQLKELEDKNLVALEEKKQDELIKTEQRAVEDSILAILKKKKEQRKNQANNKANTENQNLNTSTYKPSSPQIKFQVIFKNPKDNFTLLPSEETIFQNDHLLKKQYNDIQKKEPEEVNSLASQGNHKSLPNKEQPSSDEDMNEEDYDTFNQNKGTFQHYNYLNPLIEEINESPRQQKGDFVEQSTKPLMLLADTVSLTSLGGIEKLQYSFNDHKFYNFQDNKLPRSCLSIKNSNSEVSLPIIINPSENINLFKEKTVQLKRNNDC